ncbi:MAG: hypothetical protein KA479_03195 [Saprospiraceae bacterium]|nr:hypothetical protein [Saprospiraceae bacterium]
MKNIVRYSLILLSSFLLITACNKDVEEIKFEPELALPLFSSTSTLADLFGENTDTSSLVIGSDGSMTLVYKGDLVRREANEIFKAIPTFPGIMFDSVLSAPFTLENEINIIRAHFTAGTINVQVNSNIPEDLDFVLEFPDVTQGGQTLKVVGEIDYTGTLPVIVNFPAISTAGYDINLSGLEVNVRYFATKKSNGERVKLPTVGFLITGIKFSYLEGYFGYEVHQIQRDTITMDVFKNVLQGNLEFADPRVTIIVDNSFGFPLRSKVTVLRVSNETESADLESPLVTSGFDFGYPGLNQVGSTATTNFYFDKSNSNIKEVFNLYPIYLDYQIDAISNPDEIPNLIGFTTDSSYFALKVQVELPLHGKADGFEGDKTFDVDFSALEDMKKAELKLIAENGMPVDIIAQATLIDANGVELGTLLNDFGLILKAAPVGADGYSNGISSQITYIQADAALLEKMRLARKIRVDSRFSTTNMGQTDVHIRSSDQVNLRMGLRATLDYSIGGE